MAGGVGVAERHPRDARAPVHWRAGWVSPKGIPESTRGRVHWRAGVSLKRHPGDARAPGHWRAGWVSLKGIPESTRGPGHWRAAWVSLEVASRQDSPPGTLPVSTGAISLTNFPRLLQAQNEQDTIGGI